MNNAEDLLHTVYWLHSCLTPKLYLQLLYSHKRGLLGIPYCRPRWLSNLPFLPRMKGFSVVPLLIRKEQCKTALGNGVLQKTYCDCYQGSDASCLMQNLDIWIMEGKSLLKGENRCLEFSTNGSYTHQCLVSRLLSSNGDEMSLGRLWDCCLTWLFCFSEACTDM